MNASLQPAAAAVENPKRVKRNEVVRLSQPQSVSMAEVYFDLVHPDHFWAARRFDVLAQLAKGLLGPQKACAEIGCGNGVLQNQLAKRFGVTVDGIDLCLKALEESVAESGTLYYYDVFQKAPEFKHKYDVIFLFDVLEHIRDDLGFLNACLYHLKAGGHVVVNVPARKDLFSKYDIVAGHVRRYDLQELRRLTDAAGLETRACTYWGMPLYPVLMLRKLILSFSSAPSAYQRGFTPPNRLTNSLLRALSRLEWTPQLLLGTSIMAVLQKL
jgi:2-polyprenyl-3-methyl-5-hydroxy-6-metoxy-1,4-benzoquinol methylase